jgi:hypothetical protein
MLPRNNYGKGLETALREQLPAAVSLGGDLEHWLAG